MPPKKMKNLCQFPEDYVNRIDEARKLLKHEFPYRVNLVRAALEHFFEYKGIKEKFDKQ